jgi:hypothetical protein
MIIDLVMGTVHAIPLGVRHGVTGKVIGMVDTIDVSNLLPSTVQVNDTFHQMAISISMVILLDVKHCNGHKHNTVTGQSNAIPLDVRHRNGHKRGTVTGWSMTLLTLLSSARSMP